ncbi:MULTISPECIES: N(2)-acetyl-L-2,4-diaminobutanoate deacetylase DoeB [Vibrio]|uniref:N(2)-acetyl-L-2,4-diaminobutanoate deacetylase DoeB n=1 Tax=Vibrio TaxID=662 RepID=UPI001CF0D7EE|nr:MULTISPECIES: N(2)-acetyl-L-2,4-diaminobutanoate deacetylase DoeB [Vibrio]MDW2257559.1 N(2)-acetyl-L-2,4-diaminobutanoate deacetylase DoeB [Vibrio sp. 1409]EJL6719381.1 N(2)-acetyl-L-2,4-diaminobutanoate deacetylase DoeB [Vibrio alginolyticus]MCA6718929.1 N(2)-acetyl-L-2,4-diaminobutanoate deacetylase DoeB [Vibrio alginolyticus]MCG6325378.1 N(2)-acetyl-L-2,4-diaminobutanoate deacetylase DoeB [Vibrio alginolyticus]MDW1884498.1 N(2)-acetyl-L-2,4-diaminobutanoate deacetylase DoeB [Vibrio sp. V
MQKSSITATIDFDREGVQHGFLTLPYSHDDSAWGSIMIPITVIKNGHGPTALLTGGNHGDEYEGITSLLKLTNSLQADQIQGRVIIVPMMNLPAVQNASRTSFIDKGNLNRSFPGNPIGTVTEKIADYFTRYLVPKCDFALDIHSGGKTLDIVPFAAAHRLDNLDQEEACILGAKLFGAPYTMILLEMDATSLYDTAVESQGKIFVTTELRGGGTSTPETIAYSDRGIRNFLRFSGNLPGDYEQPTQPTKLLDMPDASCYVQSQHHGITEYLFDLGDTVKKGDVLVRIFSTERTGTAPIEYKSQRNGIFAARRFPAMVNIGDTIAVIAEDCGEVG